MSASNLVDYAFPWVYAENLDQDSAEIPLNSAIPFIFDDTSALDKPKLLGYVEHIELKFIQPRKKNLEAIFMNLFFSRHLQFTSIYLQNKNIFNTRSIGELLLHNFHSYSFLYSLISRDSKKLGLFLGFGGLFKLYDFSVNKNNSVTCPICDEVLVANFLVSFKQVFLSEKHHDELNDLELSDSDGLAKLRDAKIYYANMVVKNGLSYEIDLGMKFDSTLIPGRRHYSSLNLNGSGHILVHDLRQKNIESGFLMSSKNSQNWYHFLIEDLPKLAYCSNLDADIPLLISATTPKNGVELLKLLSNREILIISPDRIIEVDQLYLPKKTSWISDQSPKDSNFENTNFWLDREAISYIRDHLSELNTVYKCEPSLKIFVGRQNQVSRNIVNYNHVESFLIDKGFISLNLNELSVKEAINFFAQSKLSIISGGAECANLLFMQRGTTAVVTYPDTSYNFPLYRSLCEILGIKYMVTYGSAKIKKGQGILEKANSSYILKVKKLKYLLENVSS